MSVYVSSLLTATAATVNADPASTRTWQWQRNGVNISGATNQTYSAAVADIGANIAVVQTETNFLGTNNATSASVGPVVAFSPIAFFGDGSQGWWFDNDDITTLYQDSAGTTPVTAVEQSVGLQLDKSKGLVLGPELVVSQDLTNAQWAQLPATPASTTTATTLTFGGQFSGRADNIAVTAGKIYLFSFEVRRVSGNTTLRIYYDATQQTNGAADFTVDGNWKTVSRVVYATASTVDFGWQDRNASGHGTIELRNISVRELPGNHRYCPDPSGAARPKWSKRVNLFEKTEQFNDAYWALTDTTITPNATTAPDNTVTASLMTATAGTGLRPRIVSSSATTITNVAYTVSWYIKPDTYTFAQIYINNQGSEWVNFTLTGAGTASANGSCTASISLDNNGFYRVQMTYTAGSTDRRPVLIMSASGSATRAQTWNPTGAEKFFIWGADFRPANQATGLLPLYQRVNTATDYETAGFPGYLKADGLDDFLQTNSIDFTATDKITLCAGVRKLSDAAAGALAELNPTPGTGYFLLSAPGSAAPNYFWRSRGTSSADVTPTTFTAPITNVVTGIGDISGDSAIVRVNGAQVGVSTADQGTGNYINNVAYFFRRTGTSLPFNGEEYSNIAVGKLLTADQLTALETYTNSLTKAY